MVIHEPILNFETTIGKLFNYFSRSNTRQYQLKQWQNYLDLPEMKFKRLFDIRWSSMQGCIDPIIVNVQPGMRI